MKLKMILGALISAACLVSCAPGEPNTLFDTASPENGVMIMYVSDRDGTVSYWLSDNPKEHELLEKLSATTASPAKVTTADVEFPIYGFEIASDDGWGLNMSWSNGYLYNRDGQVYAFDFDFETLLADYSFEKRDTWEDRFILCERYLVLDENGWNASLMSEADEPVPPENISLAIDCDGESIQAVLHNSGETEWYFGTYWSLQVKLEDKWYQVPVSPVKNWAFSDIAYILMPGQEQEQTYQLEQYGELPAGQYRIYVSGLTAEFTVE